MKIPDGWRQVHAGERIRKGDYYWQVYADGKSKWKLTILHDEPSRTLNRVQEIDAVYIRKLSPNTGKRSAAPGKSKRANKTNG